MRGIQRMHGLRQLGSLVASGFGAVAGWRVHRQIGQHPQQMVLHHVTRGTGLVVESPPLLNAEILRHGDL
jgi:hypothetical protein